MIVVTSGQALILATINNIIMLIWMIWGFSCLFRGKLSITKRKVITGLKARLIGVVMLLDVFYIAYVETRWKLSAEYQYLTFIEKKITVFSLVLIPLILIIIIFLVFFIQSFKDKKNTFDKFSY